QLVEDLVERIDVEVVARIRALDDLEDEVRMLEHFLVADRAERLRQVGLDPAIEIEGHRELGCHGSRLPDRLSHYSAPPRSASRRRSAFISSNRVVTSRRIAAMPAMPPA